MNVDSQNSGSYNSAGRDVVSTSGTTINDYSTQTEGDGDITGCPNGNCKEDELKATCETNADCKEGETCTNGTCEGGPSVDNINYERCVANPPGGVINGTPHYNATCSCKSHYIDKKC
jgi:hypothetical protein